MRTCEHSEVLRLLEHLKRDNYKPDLVIYDLDSLGVVDLRLLKIYRRIVNAGYLDEDCTASFVGSYDANMDVAGIPLLKKPYTTSQLRNFIASCLVSSYKV